MQSKSMEPFIKQGEAISILPVDKIKRGDVVAFVIKQGQKNVTWVLRVVGIPNDTIQIQKGKLKVNNNEPPYGIIDPSSLLDSGYYQNEMFFSSEQNNWNQDNFGPLVVPQIGERIESKIGKDGAPLTFLDSNGGVVKNLYFLLGDNRMNSYDSRFIGYISEDQIIGIVKK